MSRKPEPPDRWPGFEIAIEGEGLSPAELPVRVLIELLEAAAKIVEEVAAERGAKLPTPRLVAVKTGSAAYDLRIPDKSAFAVVGEIQRQIKTRAEDAGALVRQAVQRLHDAGGRVGSVRFTPFLGTRGKPKALYVAPPTEVVLTPFDATEETQGRVVGVLAGNKLSVKLRLDDGKIQDFRTEDEEIARRAARLFLKPVRVQFQHAGSDEALSSANLLLAIEQREGADDDFVAEIESLRQEIEKTGGPKLRATDWLRELGEDE